MVIMVSDTSALGHEAAKDCTSAAMDPNPPFMSTYKQLFAAGQPLGDAVTASVEECELPVIDLGVLSTGDADRCKRDIAAASMEWGFFQLVNHGISEDLLKRIREEQVRIFRRSFEEKASEKLLDFAADSYRWGTPSPTSLQQLSWSEAYHIPLTPSKDPNKHHTRKIIEEYAVSVSQLAHELAEILAEGLGRPALYFKDNCSANTCFLRLNRYPPCPAPAGAVCGLTRHTDSSFLTILTQDQVGGLQLMKGGGWITVKPNPNALVINIGDLFQAWSNGVFKSVEHRVLSNPQVERFSVAYFFCPSYETVIESDTYPHTYRKFSFKEYKHQVQEDVRLTGHKIGLSRFLA